MTTADRFLSGCTIRDRHTADCPCGTSHDDTHEGHCRGCLPRPADEGALCTRCRSNLERNIREAPSIVEWIREHVEPSRQWGERTNVREVDAPAPLSLSAVDDADTLHACLASWALLVMEEHPSALQASAPRRQRRAVDGTVVGLMPDSDATTSICRFLSTHLDWCTGQPWAGELAFEVGSQVRTLLARYPHAERSRHLADAKCRVCHRTSMVYQPPAWHHGSILVQCEHADCGAIVPESEWGLYMRMVEEDRKREKEAS